LGDQIEKNEMGGALSKYRGEMTGIQCFGGETWGKETTWKTQNTGEDNIKMYLQEVGWGGGAWTSLIWLKLGTGGGHL